MTQAADVAAALRPGTIGTLRLPNRIVMGAMHLNIEGREDGGAALAEFYATRARGGAGLLVTGGSAVNRTGAGGRYYSFVNEPAQQPMLARAAEAVHAEGGKIALQLFHAGRYAHQDSFGLTPLAPSAVYSKISRCTPEAASEEQILDTIADFARGAAAAAELGFDAVEVMGSEGYLINQFCSPLTNLRDDDWGGDPVRRRRFAREVARAVAGAGLPVLFRMSGTDLMPEGTPDAEAADLAAELVDAGAHAITLGIGWHESPVPTVQTVVPHGMWTPWARTIRDRLHGTGVPVVAANRINSLEQASAVIERGDADFVAMARPLLADPDLVAKHRRGTPELVNTCIACDEACIDRSLGDAPVSCLVNPRAGRELDFAEEPTAAGGRFAVVGAGPAGLEAARALAALGHAVELFEAGSEIGGQFRLARLVPGKADFGRTLDYYRAELARLGVTVRTGTAVGDELPDGFDGVVLATGVSPRVVDLPGADLPHVLDYPYAFTHPEEVGERVAVVGGGGIACDLAHLLAEPPSPSETERFRRRYGLDGGAEAPAARRVTVMRRSGKVGAGIGITTRWAVLDVLRAHGTEMLTGVEYRKITPEGVHIVDGDDRERLVAADTVVVAAGQEPEDSLHAGLRARGAPVRVVGGASGTARLNAVRATEEGLRAAHDLHGELASRRP